MGPLSLIALWFTRVSSENAECFDDACPARVDSFLQHKAAADVSQMCAGPCACDEYVTGGINVSCSKVNDKEVELTLAKDATKLIVALLNNTDGLKLELEAEGDIDLKLYDESTCVVGPSGCKLTSEGSIEYSGMNITYSGDDTTDPVVEFITIEGVTPKKLELIALAYASGTGKVTFSHGEVQPCQKDECSKCNDAMCGSGETRQCDGSRALKCIPVATTTTTMTTTTTPTDPPTAAPTDPPTDPPTAPPTAAPTDPPTDPPTNPPTVAPTVPPTVAPTDPPTAAPTPIQPGCAEGAAFKYKVDTDLWLCALDNQPGGTWKSAYSSCNERAGFHLATVSCMTKRGSVRNSYATASIWARSKGFQYLVTGQPDAKKGGMWNDMLYTGMTQRKWPNEQCDANDGSLGYIPAHGNIGLDNWQPLFDNNFAYGMCAGQYASALISICQNVGQVIGAMLFDHRCRIP